MGIHETLRDRFEDYRPEVASLAEQLAAGGDIRTVPGYIDSGTDSHVLRLSSDPLLVVKLPFRSGVRGETPKQITRKYVKAFVAGLGGVGLTQIVGYNADRRRQPFGMICEYAEGPTLGSLDEEERDTLSVNFYRGLLGAFEALQLRRLGLDRSQGNIVCNPLAPQNS